MCGPLDGRSLLDVATGTEHTALHLAGSARLVADLDLTPQMLELARDAGREDWKTSDGCGGTCSPCPSRTERSMC